MTSYIRSLVSYLISQFDARVATQEAREDFYKRVVVFSRQQPFLASFIAIQLLFGLLPVLGFVGFVLGVIGLAVGFVTFWIGVGLCVVFSILLVTASVATFAWISALTSLLCIKWVYGMLSSSAPAPAPARETNGRVKRTEEVRGGEVKEGASKIEDGAGVQKYENDTEGSDDTIGSYGALNRYTDRVKSEDLKWVKPDAASDAEKMRRDIERSLK